MSWSSAGNSIGDFFINVTRGGMSGVSGIDIPTIQEEREQIRIGNMYEEYKNARLGIEEEEGNSFFDTVSNTKDEMTNMIEGARQGYTSAVNTVNKLSDMIVYFMIAIITILVFNKS